MHDEPIHARQGGRLTRLLKAGRGGIGLLVLGVLLALCLGTLPYTLGNAGSDRDGFPLGPRYKHGDLTAALLPPSWSSMRPDERSRAEAAARQSIRDTAYARLRRERGPDAEILESELPEPTAGQVDEALPFHLLGTDKLGRDLFIRCLAGGGVSIGIGLAAALISVVIGTIYGAVAGYMGGRADALMMRIVDILYGLPYLLLVVLLAVAGDALLDTAINRTGQRDAFITSYLNSHPDGNSVPAQAEALRLARDRFPAREISEGLRSVYEIGVLLIAIGGLSWLTLARVIRGQVLSLKAQPFMEAARALGVPLPRQFLRHLLPNLIGPIIVYATLTVPQAILQESFLSFLGIGVRPPLPSWGNLASEGLVELNPIRTRWWLILFPCLLLATTLLALNFMGEGLRESFDPRRKRRT